jgi:hypothetical protein
MFAGMNVADLPGDDSAVQPSNTLGDGKSEGGIRERLRAITFRGGALFERDETREYVIPEWILGHGYGFLLGKRGVGKSAVALDLALHVAGDMPWCGEPVTPGFHAVYICAEDDLGAVENIRAWCGHRGIDTPPDRFICVAGGLDLMNAEEVRAWTEHLRDEIGDGRAVLFCDTWQRLTAGASQNDDEMIGRAIGHIEAMARSLRGPAVIGANPLKHDESTVAGAYGQENNSSFIIRASRQTQNRINVEVDRIKGRGEGNHKLFNLSSVDLNLTDEFGRERSGVVASHLGGVQAHAAESDTARRIAMAVRDVVLAEMDKDPATEKRRIPVTLSIAASELKNATRHEIEFKGKRTNENLINKWLVGRPPVTFDDGLSLHVVPDQNGRKIFRIDRAFDVPEE